MGRVEQSREGGVLACLSADNGDESKVVNGSACKSLMLRIMAVGMMI